MASAMPVLSDAIRKTVSRIRSIGRSHFLWGDDGKTVCVEIDNMGFELKSLDSLVGGVKSFGRFKVAKFHNFLSPHN